MLLLWGRSPASITVSIAILGKVSMLGAQVRGTALRPVLIAGASLAGPSAGDVNLRPVVGMAGARLLGPGATEPELIG